MSCIDRQTDRQTENDDFDESDEGLLRTHIIMYKTYWSQFDVVAAKKKKTKKTNTKYFSMKEKKHISFYLSSTLAHIRACMRKTWHSM